MLENNKSLTLFAFYVVFCLFFADSLNFFRLDYCDFFFRYRKKNNCCADSLCQLSFAHFLFIEK